MNTVVRLGGRLGATVMHKLLGIVGLCLMATVVVAVIGIWQMSRIGAEIEAVAEEDMPLTAVVSRVTVHQLEQAVLLERILRLSGLITETTPEELQAVEDEFERLSAVVDEEVLAGARLAETAISHAGTPEERAEFEKVLAQLRQIEGEHKTYHDDAKTLELKRLEEERAQEEVRREEEKRQQMLTLPDSFEKAVEDADRANHSVNCLSDAAQKIGAVVSLIHLRLISPSGDSAVARTARADRCLRVAALTTAPAESRQTRAV